MDIKAREQAKAKVQAMAAKLTDEALCIAWMATETQPVTEVLAITRGWMLDELQVRLGDDLFDEWLVALDENGDSLNPLGFFQRKGADARTPYDAEHVQIVASGNTVTALYIPDPEQAKDPRHVLDNILDSAYQGVEVVATATRCFKSQGAAVSGWIIASGSDHGSEGYPNKQAMRDALRLTIRSYFTR